MVIFPGYLHWSSGELRIPAPYAPTGTELDEKPTPPGIRQKTRVEHVHSSWNGRRIQEESE